MSREHPIAPDPVIEFYKKDVDVTLLRENLKLTPDQRIRNMVELAKFAEELRRAGREAKKKQAKQGKGPCETE